MKKARVVTTSALISFGCQSSDTHGHPMASIYKTYLQREGYIYKKSTFQGFYVFFFLCFFFLQITLCIFPPELTSSSPRFPRWSVRRPAQRSKVYSFAAQKCWDRARSALQSQVHVQDNSSNHEGILIFKFFKFFNLLSQKQYPLLAQSRLNFTYSN